MEKQIKGSYPLKVKTVYLDNGKTLKDKTVMIVGNFLVVDCSGDREDPRPNMYNLSHVYKLEKVEEIRPQMKISGM